MQRNAADAARISRFVSSHPYRHALVSELHLPHLTDESSGDESPPTNRTSDPDQGAL